MLVASCPRCRHQFPLSLPLPSPCCQPLVALQLPAGAACTATVTVTPRRVQVGMTGGGIVHDADATAPSVVAHHVTSGCGGRLIVNAPLDDDLSPSAPVAFVLPTPNPRDSKRPPSVSDLERLSAAVKALRTCGWYYEGLSWQDSATLLAPTSPGTFLVRDSSDPRFLFSLSVQTERGPTSVRLHYRDGHFRLDAAPKLVPLMPVFRCVVELVQHYVSTTGKGTGTKGREQVWIDCSGQTYSSILLTRPLYQRGRVPRLQHLARLTVNRVRSCGQSVPTHDLPECLHRYLDDYPYTQ